MASKRNSLSIHEKATLIRAIAKGEKKSDVGRRYGLRHSSVSTIWKNKEKILRAEMDGKTSKKLRNPKFENLDQAMSSWCCNQRQNNISFSGTTMKAKAQEFAEQLSITDFKASEGWLGKFKQRHRINCDTENGGALDVNAHDQNSSLSNDVVIKEENEVSSDEIELEDEPEIYEQNEQLNEEITIFTEPLSSKDVLDTSQEKNKESAELNKETSSTDSLNVLNMLALIERQEKILKILERQNSDNTFDNFARYVSCLLATLPKGTAYALQPKIIEMITSEHVKINNTSKVVRGDQ